MMPDMDGIEATEIIREWEMGRGDAVSDRIPIIALTANAVSGVREMFIEKGFDDFLAKPVDVSELDEILNKWILKIKREQEIEEQEENDYNFPGINGVDIQKGIKMTGGTLEGYISVLSTFRKDVIERLLQLRNTLYEESLSLFTTHVHALKSAAAAIGAAELSVEAATLESAGKEGNREYINENLETFLEHLSILNEGVYVALEIEKASCKGTIHRPEKGELIPLLRSLRTAVRAQKVENIDVILDELNHLLLDRDIMEAVEKISDDILMTEFDSALENIDDIMTKVKQQE
jgi:CheY-like chemotaxis protein